ncbi:MAG: nitrilase [Firmicutes bacterium]|nr:nitrilase [Bacillota bacterium]
MKFQERLFFSYLTWRTRPAVIRRHLQKKHLPERRQAAAPASDKVRVAAAQVEFKLFKDVRAYVDEMARIASSAAREGAQLLVFPENNNYQLLGLLPGVDKLVKEADAAGRPEKLPVADLFRIVGPIFLRIAAVTFSWLAKRLGLYIVAGSFPCPEGGKVYNRALIYAPDGSMLGSQDKVHLMPLEISWGFSPGKAFHVFPTAFGGLAAPVCMDATYFETFRVVAALGADIVAIPIANPEEYNTYLALRGIWPRVQETPVYGIKSALVGKILGFTLTGKAGVFSPLELTQSGDGVLAEAKSFDREELVTATLDLAALRRLRAHHPRLMDRNPEYLAKYLPWLYQANAT